MGCNCSNRINLRHIAEPRKKEEQKKENSSKLSMLKKMWEDAKEPSVKDTKSE